MRLSNQLPYRIPNIKNKRLRDPHVVILGAGASIAACPQDKNGKKVPVLANIHHVLGLTEELRKYGFSENEMVNFELLYSNIYDEVRYSELTQKLAQKVREYFQSLCIPDNVTIYDYLILSLTSKDAIITFNWDPFLMQAYRRNLNVGNLPQLIFPHGNVGAGLCYKCKVKGYANCLCPTCYKPFQDMPLLFPISKKNYNKEPIIRNEWSEAKNYLSKAAGITIFGYGAPETDREAYDLLKLAYKSSNVIDIAPFNIINLAKEKDTQLEKWAEIFDGRMCSFYEHFNESILWRNPRVSLEYLFDAILQQRPREYKKSYSDFSSLEELQEFVKSITEFDMAIY